MHKKLFNRDFILLMQGSAVSYLGDILYSVAISYWVYANTGSTTLMGLTASISMLVRMFLLPFAGSIIDRTDRRWMIVMMDAIRGVVLCITGAIAFSGHLSITVILITAFIAALCGTFFSPAINTALIDVIPHDEMMRGQSMSGTISSIINLVGDAISGVLVVSLGVPLIIVINGISYLLSALTEVFIRLPKTSKQGEKISIESVLIDIKGAIKKIFEDKALKIFIPVAIIINLLGAGSMDLFMAFILESGFDIEDYSVFAAAQTAASLLVVFILSIHNFSHKTRYLMFVGGFIGSGIFFLIAYNIRIFYIMLPALFIASALNVLGNSVFSAALTLALPEGSRGAILGFFTAASVGGSALSSLLYGFLCDHFATWTIFSIGTILSIIPIIYMCLNKNSKRFILEN